MWFFLQKMAKDPLQLKKEGNEAFAEGDWDKALSLYTEAIKLTESDSADKAVLYKNKAAVYLKLSDYQAVIQNCTSSLEITPNDPKALFRRCQAYEALEKYEEAYKDVRQAHHYDGNSKATGPALQRLHDIVQDRVRPRVYWVFSIYIYIYIYVFISIKILILEIYSWLNFLKQATRFLKWWK